jgi:hypothetical protein
MAPGLQWCQAENWGEGWGWSGREKNKPRAGWPPSVRSHNPLPKLPQGSDRDVMGHRHVDYLWPLQQQCITFFYPLPTLASGDANGAPLPTAHRSVASARHRVGGQVSHGGTEWMSGSLFGSYLASWLHWVPGNHCEFEVKYPPVTSLGIYFVPPLFLAVLGFELRALYC